ncbi:MAG: hypothetical protein ACRDEB_02215 [Chitinophagaceae bacterium]
MPIPSSMTHNGKALLVDKPLIPIAAIQNNENWLLDFWDSPKWKSLKNFHYDAVPPGDNKYRVGFHVS